MVEHLVAGHAPGDGLGLVEVVDIEIADAPRADFSGLLQGREGGDGLGERMRAAPVQEVAVEPVGAQPRQRALARRSATRPWSSNGSRRNTRRSKPLRSGKKRRSSLAIAKRLSSKPPAHAMA
jgi:hypothetical protein